MNKLTSKYKITIRGLNLHHVLAFFEHEKMEVLDLQRLDDKALTCVLSKKDYKKFRKAPLSSTFKISVDRTYGLDKHIKTFISNLGIVIGILICLFSVITITDRVLVIHINTQNHICTNGEECIFKEKNLEALKQALTENGVKEHVKISSLPSPRQLEQKLMLQFNQIAGVSLTQKSVHVYVDIIESKLPTTQDKYSLVAPENGIVISTNITSGNSNVKIGDIVLKGDVLVSSLDSKPVTATIVLRTFYHESVIYNENQVKYQKTGRTYNSNSISFMGLSTNSSTTPPYSLYESETNNRYAFLNMFLPIKISNTTYYELEAVDIILPFTEEETNIKEKLTDQTRLLLPSNAEEKNVTFVTYQEGTRYRVDCYIETYLTIKK